VKKSFNIQELCTASANVMEPSPCTLLVKSFPKTHQEHDLKHPSSVVLITTKQNKTKHLPS
jgi:hypothetical protein